MNNGERIAQKEADKKGLLALVIVFFFISFFVRFGVADFLKQLSIYGDELTYLSVAKSISAGAGVLVYGHPFNFQNFLYSIVISPAFMVTSDDLLQIKIVALINALIMSLGVFPVYLMAKDLLQKRWGVIVACAAYLLLPDMCYSMTFMSEVLFMPLGTAAIYVFYKMTMCQETHKRNILCVVFALVLFLLYLCKAVALVFLVAYVVFLVFEFIISGQEEKEKRFKALLKELVIVVGIFGIGYFFLKNVVFHGETSFYTIMNRPDLLVLPGRIRYILYGFIYYLCNAVIAMGILPVILPVLHFKDLTTKAKQLFLFSAALLLVSAAVVAYTITVREDFDNLVPRAHLRYICYLTIPFYLAFLSLFEKKIYISRNNFIKTTAVLGTLMAFLIVFYRGVTIPDIIGHTSLLYLTLLSEDQILLYMILWTILVGVWILLYYKKSKLFIRSFCAIMAAILLGANLIASTIYRRTYQLPEMDFGEVETISEFIRENKQKTFLAITDESVTKFQRPFIYFHRVFDTYLNYPNVKKTTLNSMEENQTQEGTNLQEQKLSMYLYGLAYDIDAVDYVLAETGILLDGYGAEDIVIESDFLTVYKLRETHLIPKVVDIWAAEGGTLKIEINDRLFASGYPIENGKFISQDQDGCLVFGPYRELEPGKYSVKFNYSYAGDLPAGTVIGYVDLAGDSAEIQGYRADLVAGETSVTIDGVTLNTACTNVETRFFSSEPGIVAESIEITRTPLEQ